MSRTIVLLNLVLYTPSRTEMHKNYEDINITWYETRVREDRQSEFRTLILMQLMASLGLSMQFYDPNTQSNMWEKRPGSKGPMKYIHKRGTDRKKPG